MNARSYIVSGILWLGLVWTYVGERIVEPGTSRTVHVSIGLALVLAATAIRFVRVRQADGERRGVESAFVGLYAIALAALAMYFAQSDLPTRMGGELLSQSWPKLAGSIAAVWPAVMAFSVLPIVLMEMSYAAMARAPRVEGGRVRDAMLSGLGLAGAMVFAFSLMYVVTERDAKWDLSHFRTAKPGEATRKIIQALDQPVEVTLFFPPANEVAEQVVGYLEDLKKESPYLKVEVLDQALEQARARELNVFNNGTMVVGRGSRRETVMIGQDLEKSRLQLRSLDQEFQKRLLIVARSRKTVYLTAGHGERRRDPAGPGDTRATIELLYNELKAQNYDLRQLGLAEGLGNEIPSDAAAVLVIGPTEAFQEPEVAALKRYFEKGGRFLVALDPEAGLDFSSLLGGMGVAMSTQVLANDVAFARKRNQISDRTIIGTSTYSSHASVSTNGRMNYPLFLMGAGSLEQQPKELPPELTVDFAVRAHPSTWNDFNGDYQHNPPLETRRAYGLVAAVTRRGAMGKAEEGRAVVLADSDALADEVLQVSRGNGFFALDALKWLLGDEAIAGATNTEMDTPIQRTRKQDVFFFYSTIFLAPAAVVVIGYLAARRRKGSRKS